MLRSACEPIEKGIDLRVERGKVFRLLMQMHHFLL